MTPTGRDRNIDTVLTLFDLKIQITDKEVEKFVGSESFNTTEQMLLIGLIKGLDNIISEGGTCYILTSFGIEVKRSGSWTGYQENKEEEKKVNRQLIASSLRANWLQKWLLIATTVFSFLALVVAVVDIAVHKKELQVAREELKLHKLEIQTATDQQSQLKTDTSKLK